MSLNYHKFNGSGIRIPILSADPGSPIDGLIWYNSTGGVVKMRQGGTTVSIGEVSGEFDDAVFRIFDNGDNTKQLAFECSGISGSTTRTITMPDADVDLALLATAVQADGSVAMTGALDMGTNKVTNMGAGSASGDAVEYDQFNTALGLKIDTAEKGSNNGVATLDGGGKVPASQLPSSVMEYKGSWDASTNTPTLADGVGDAGDVYIVSVAGTQDLGSGSISFAQGDWIIYNGAVWEKSLNSNAVVSVNGQTGVVVLDTGDISENGNLYFTNARVLASVLTGFSAGSDTAIDSSDTVLAGLQKAQGQINARIREVSEDSTPALGGDLDVGSNALIHGASGIEKGPSAGNTYFDDYDHNITLAASTTAVVTEFTMAYATLDCAKIDYRISSTAGVRVGSLLVATDGVNASLTDSYTETADLGISFSAAVNGLDLEISFNNSSANAGTLRGMSRRFKA